MDMYHAVLFLLEQQIKFGDVPTASAARGHVDKIKLAWAELSPLAEILAEGRGVSGPAGSGASVVVESDAPSVGAGAPPDPSNPHHI